MNCMKIERRKFLKSSLAFVGLKGEIIKPKRKYCFNTLACPTWEWSDIILNARKYGFSAVELRGIGGEIDLRKCGALSAMAIKDSMRIAESENIKVLNLNSSAHLHEIDNIKNQINLDEAKSYIDLAASMGCPYVRVFPEKFPFVEDRKKSLNVLIENLRILTDYCKGTGVKVLLDAHGDLVYADDIAEVMGASDWQNSGIIWDFFNMHLKTRESATEMYTKLKKYTRIIQIKDGHFLPEKKYEYCLTGVGEVPIAEILKLADKGGYDGYFSFEWEKRWHDELPNPELALPHFIQKMNAF